MTLPTTPRPATAPATRWLERIARAKKRTALSGAPPRQHTVGEHLGLCIPVAFPDVPVSMSNAQIDAFLNAPGYRDFGNNGSVQDYFRALSGGKLVYRTLVAPLHVATRSRDHWVDPAIPFGVRSAELVTEAVLALRAQGFDFAALSVDGNDAVRAINLFYAGPVVNEHGTGLWPHASTLPGTGLELGDGRSARDYQVTNLGDALALGVYCHENGHMLCDFPDLYEYKRDGGGCGSFCLMCFGAVADDRNPTHVGAYLRYKAGWVRPRLLVPAQAGAGAASQALMPGDALILQHSLTEYLLLEYRLKEGRDAALPDEGLAIWHVDELGSNAAPQDMLDGHRHHECRLLQADGRNDLGAGAQYGDATDLFAPTSGPLFKASSVPRWWNGTPTGLQIRDLRADQGGLRFELD